MLHPPARRDRRRWRDLAVAICVTFALQRTDSDKRTRLSSGVHCPVLAQRVLRSHSLVDVTSATHHPQTGTVAPPEFEDDYPAIARPAAARAAGITRAPACGGAPRDEAVREPRRELLARLERNAARLEQIYKTLSERALCCRLKRRPRNGCATTTTSSARSCSRSGATCRGSTTRSCPR